MKKRQTITVITERGTFSGTLSTDDLRGLEAEADPTSLLLRTAADGQLESLRLVTDDGYLIIGCDLLANSVIKVG